MHIFIYLIYCISISNFQITYIQLKDYECIQEYYLERIAITGSRLEASTAGIMPDKTPITTDTPKPSEIFAKLSNNLSASCGIRVIRNTIKIPTPPPIKLK